MAKYDELRTLSFEFAPDITELPYETQALALPESYKKLLLSATKDLSPKKEQVRIPLRSLNNVIRALIPDVVSIESNADEENRGWLHSYRRIDTEKIHAIILAWVEAEYSWRKYDNHKLTQLLGSLDPSHLVWRNVKTNLAAWRAGSNGTAKPKNGLAFQLLPGKIALELAKVSYHLESKPLNFLRTTGEATSRYAELISWPPVAALNQRRGSATPENWLFSFFMRVSVQTLPTVSTPRGYVHLGVKRWVSDRQLHRLPPDHNTSVYLRTHVPWIEGLHEADGFTDVFTVARAKGFGEKKRWADNLTRTLASLSANPEVFSVERLDNPREAINFERVPNMAVVHHHQIGDHDVGTGVLLRNRKQLAEQIADALQPNFTLSAAPKRVDVSPSLFTKPQRLLLEERDRRAVKNEERKKPKAPFTDGDYAQLRAQVAQSIGQEIHLELWTQTDEVKQALLAEIGTVFNMSVSDVKEQVLSSPELQLKVRSHKLGALGDALQTDGQKKGRRERAVRRRTDQIKNQLGNATLPTLSLTEIDGRDRFKYNRDADPKNALRKGFGETGRVSQFLVKGEKDVAHRAEAALGDGLRQLGFSAPIPTLKTYPDMRYLTFWILDQRDYGGIIPIALLMSADGTLLRCTSPCLNRQWLSYPNALLRAAKGEFSPIKSPKEETQRQVETFIKNLLDVDFRDSTPTLLLARAQKTRNYLTCIQDGKVKRDTLLFNGEPFLISDWPGLRVARIRDDESDETPEWYAENEEDYGLASGVFRIEDGIFASVAGKPKTQTSLAKGTSRFSYEEDGELKPGNTRKAAWNPGLKEMFFVGLQPDDNEAAWVHLVHRLRDASNQTSDTIALPYMLHLAKQIGEYLRR